MLPDDQIFIIPVRLDNSQVPQRFGHLQYVDLFKERGFDKVVRAIRTTKKTPIRTLKLNTSKQSTALSKIAPNELDIQQQHSKNITPE